MVDSIVEVIRNGVEIHMLGDAIVERVDWMRPSTTITRTYWDGEKLVTEAVDPAEFYEEIPSNVGNVQL